MADAVVTIAAERIGDLLKEAQFLSDVRDQVEEIQEELQRMKCFLKDAYEKQVKDARVRNWIKEVKILAERIEDLLEIYALKVASEKGDGVKQVFLKRFSCSFSKCVVVHKIGSEIARVRTKILNLTTSLQSYGITSINEGESSRANDAEQERWRRMSYPHLVEEDFVGIDDTVEKLVSLLINEDQPRHLSPVSIWGMGGVGKTTIARQVYNHNHVQRNFEGFAWICVTQECETRRLLQDLLKQLLPGERREEIMSMGDQELVTRLYKVQQEKKCLVILDDIWKMEDWDCLRPAFPIEKKGIAGSKLLLTTRIKQVAEIGHVHELHCLNEDDGWELLQKKAIPKLGDEDIEVDAEMEKVGRDMVHKCGGLPLAIVVLGGILKTKYTINDWKAADRAIVSYLSKGKGVEKKNVAVEQVLLLSYNNLPRHLKTCFLYLGEYLEDQLIWAYELCVKWIIGGVVSTDDQREGETMLEVAERYLGDLAQRSMVQVELDDGMTWFRNSKFKFCSLHDLMRDICLAKAKEEEFSSVIAIKSHGNELVSSSSTGVPHDFNPRRLAIYYYDYEAEEKSVALDLEPVLGSIDWQRIRSLVLTYTSIYGIVLTPTSNHIEYPLCIGNCTMLRYLELERIKFPNGKLPRRITRLVHLRHLKFRFCILKELPASIGNLRYLQVLHLRVSYPAQLIIPNVFWKMRQLMNLNLPFNTRVKKDQKLRLDGLSKLELLQGIDICQFNVKDVAKLANLRFIELLINGNSIFEDVAWFINYVNMDTSHHISGVRLSFIDCDFSPEEGRSILQRVFQCSVRLTWWVYNSKLPKLSFDETHCSYQLNNLTEIILEKSEFEEDPFQILEKLPNLRYLYLAVIDFPGKEMVCSAIGFSQLRVLWLKCLSNLEVWKMDIGAMPNLSQLEIHECSNLKILPDQLRYLTTLKILKIFQMPQEFQNRVGVVNGIQGEDFDKIQHVRTLIIG